MNESPIIITAPGPVRYYDTAYVMRLFHIAPKNYTTLGRICRKLKLPRIRIGKQLLFPVEQFNRRLEVIEEEKLKEFKIA